MSLLAQTIQDLRKAAGLPRAALSRRSGVTCATICNLEQGGARDPRLSTLLALAEALGCSLDALVGRSVVRQEVAVWHCPVPAWAGQVRVVFEPARLAEEA